MKTITKEFIDIELDYLEASTDLHHRYLHNKSETSPTNKTKLTNDALSIAKDIITLNANNASFKDPQFQRLYIITKHIDNIER